MSFSYLVIIPTYNEAESLPILLRELVRLRPDFNFLVVDDGSPDGTAEICEKLKGEISGLEVLSRPTKSGLGSAYRDGYKVALAKKFDAVIQIDADGSHRVADLTKLLEKFESSNSVDLVIGSRWIRGGSVLNWSKQRELSYPEPQMFTANLCLVWTYLIQLLGFVFTERMQSESLIWDQ